MYQKIQNPGVDLISDPLYKILYLSEYKEVWYFVAEGTEFSTDDGRTVESSKQPISGCSGPIWTREEMPMRWQHSPHTKHTHTHTTHKQT